MAVALISLESDKQMSATLKSLRALSDPTRLRIVALLQGSELSVHELQEITRMGQSRISTHLAHLRRVGLVQPRREGKRTYYSLVKKLDKESRQILESALLTLAGYSINDTIVVFDRIREELKLNPDMRLRELINLSTNQMVTRTILTSAATAMALIPMYFFGGPALADFSGPILFGIIIGTFSSTYVAAALLLYLPAPAGGVDSSNSAAEVSA